ncbi:MAG TPA: glucose-6-phosphate dehydrogenase [Acetobacteraceae bacterium]|jgi:glucose-6-phosphate 1-dehydrogenase|nr:glucose-6-phosphate dehydrogenase [Acetobacteraceae bacterium]
MAVLPSDAIVFFGATGDLAYKQIFPSLLGLVRDEGLNVPIIGVAKANWNLDHLKARAADSLQHHGLSGSPAAQRLMELLRYVDGDYNDPATFTELRKQLGAAKHPLHYLAVPPSLFATVAEALAQSGCADNARLVIEKPFGHNRETARTLSRLLAKFFPEENIFRIDHYLGKEPVQNIVYTRFANSMFEPLWTRDHVSSIQITMAEDFGVQDRGRFYDETGAIRDVVQNHMLQVLAQLTMDPPTGEEHEAMRDQKSALLKAMAPLDPAHVVRGQYTGYQAVPGVRPGSTVETFVAVKLFIETWRWAGVPIYIRAGKHLPVTATEIVVHFKRPPRETFEELVPLSSGHVRMRISPDVSIAMGVRVKLPGERMIGEDVEMILTEQAPNLLPPYQRLLGDAVHGVGELFGRDDIVDAQWRVVDPILDDATPVYPYEPGTWGPTEAEALIGADGPWRNPQPALEVSK